MPVSKPTLKCFAGFELPLQRALGPTGQCSQTWWLQILLLSLVQAFCFISHPDFPLAARDDPYRLLSGFPPHFHPTETNFFGFKWQDQLSNYVRRDLNFMPSSANMLGDEFSSDLSRPSERSPPSLLQTPA